MGPSPCYSQSPVVCIPSFRLVAQFFFLSGKSAIFGFFIQKGCGHIRHTLIIPLVTLILNIYGSNFKHESRICGQTDRLFQL